MALNKVIFDTVDKFEKLHPIERESREKIPFYHWDEVLQELQKFRFFENYSFDNL